MKYLDNYTDDSMTQHRDWLKEEQIKRQRDQTSVKYHGVYVYTFPKLSSTVKISNWFLIQIESLQVTSYPTTAVSKLFLIFVQFQNDKHLLHAC